MIIGQRIRELCKKRNITICKLERDAGLSRSTIVRWQKADPKLKSLIMVADYFNVSIDYLVGRKTENVNDS